MTAHLLIVEDDENLRLVLEDNLLDHGFKVFTVPNCEQALSTVSREKIDLILLDIMLPDGNGYELCQRLRANQYTGRILMLTARTLEDDIVHGLKIGADDYLTKPYRLKELLARIDVLLNRRYGHGLDNISLGSYEINTQSRRVTSTNDAEIDLTRKEFDLLVELAREPGLVKTRDVLLDEVWGKNVVVDYRTVDNFISSLRKKLNCDETSKLKIESVRGVGYRLETAD